MSYFFTKKSSFGLNIQSDVIQVIELKDKALNHFIYDSVLIKNNPLEHFSIDLSISKEIAAIIKKNQLTSNCVALHLPHYLTKEDTIIVPQAMKEMDVRNEIEARIEANFPSLSKQVHYDFIREKDIRRKQEKIHFVFVRKHYLQQLINVTQKAGLTIKSIATEQQTLKKVWQFLDKKTDKLHGILSINHKHAYIVIFKHNQFSLSEETEWNSDLNHLNQFLNLIAATSRSLELNLLLTGNRNTLELLLLHQQAFSAKFQLLSFSENQTLSPIEQAELYLAFGLALWKFSDA